MSKYGKSRNSSRVLKWREGKLCVPIKVISPFITLTFSLISSPFFYILLLSSAVFAVLAVLEAVILVSFCSVGGECD